jgi:hypothetical protein
MLPTPREKARLYLSMQHSVIYYGILAHEKPLYFGKIAEISLEPAKEVPRMREMGFAQAGAASR